MFNNSLKKEALRIHENELRRYNASYEIMSKSCEQLYDVRRKTVEIIKLVQNVVNSIANTPKEFATKMGKIDKELKKFTETEKYANEAYNASIKAGINIAGGAAAGIGVASMAPTALMSIATTFGTASTGTAISTLSGAAAQKAAMAWIGRTFAGFAVKEGVGMAAGKTFLALAGPVGWSITAATTGISLISLSQKNKELADNVVEEAKDISAAREALDETTVTINSLRSKTDMLYGQMYGQKAKIIGFMHIDYMSVSDNDKYFLGTLVNNALSLSELLNETLE